MKKFLIAIGVMLGVFALIPPVNRYVIGRKKESPDGYNK